MNFNKVKFEASYGICSQLPVHDCAEIVFVGRSNVGKSSAINKLCNRKDIARVSSTPGKTTTINYFDIDGIKLVDLPGYGYAKRSLSERERWAELIEGYFADVQNIKLVVMLIDIRHEPSSEDMHMFRLISQLKLPQLVVATKLDKLNKTERNIQILELRERLNNCDILPVSSLTGEGFDTLRETISNLIEAKI